MLAPVDCEIRNSNSTVTEETYNSLNQYFIWKNTSLGSQIYRGSHPESGLEMTYKDPMLYGTDL